MLRLFLCINTFVFQSLFKVRLRQTDFVVCILDLHMNTIYKVTQPRHQRKEMKRKVLVVYLSNHVQRERYVNQVTLHKQQSDFVLPTSKVF